MELNKWAEKIHELSVSKGWYDNMDDFMDLSGQLFLNTDISEYNDIQLAYLCQHVALIGTEVMEAMQELRNENGDRFVKELVDVLIRTLDLLQCFKINIDREVFETFYKNKAREYKHGKRF